MSPGSNAGFNAGGVHGNMNSGFNPVMSIEGILIMLIRVLMFILVLSLALAAIMYVKSLYENGKLNMFRTTSMPSDSTTNECNNSINIDTGLDNTNPDNQNYNQT